MKKIAIFFFIIIAIVSTIAYLYLNYNANIKEAQRENLEFERYAEKEIKVTMKGSKITFYNDGPKLDEKDLENIFSPYKKGINGQFGLGLSIVRETLAFCGYEVTVKNEKKGVSFMIQ